MMSRRDRIRKLLSEGGELATTEVAKEMGEERALINHDMQSLFQRGEVERVSRGRYRLKSISKRARMWKIIRARGKVTAEDLVELTGVCLQYALEYLRVLETQKLMVRKRRGDNKLLYLLKNDIGPITPFASNTEVARLLAWKRVMKARTQVDQAMNTFSRELEAYDAKYGDNESHGDAA